MKDVVFSTINLKTKRVLLLILVFFALLMLQTPVLATDWYVRSGCTTNGNGTNSSCGAAWSSFASIQWSYIKPGDTLWVIGTFTTSDLAIKSAGSETGGYVTVRGDNSAGAGIIGQNGTWRQVCVNNYVKVSGLTVYGSIRRCTDSYYQSTQFQIVKSTNEIRDYNKGLIRAGFTPNDQFRIQYSTLNGSAKPFGVLSVSDKGTYESLIVNTDGAIWNLVDEGPGAYQLEKFKKLAYVVIDQCRIVATGQEPAIDPLDLGGISNLVISNNDVNGSGLNIMGAIYIDFRDSWIRPTNVTIEKNYIHDIGSPTNFSSDAHCIGLQAGSSIKIKNNHLKNCAAGIVIYPGSTTNTRVDGLEIIGNLIEGMNTTLHDQQFPGCGIVFSGADQCPLCTPATVAYNVIASPLNCPGNSDSKCVGIKSKWLASNRIFNNTLVGNDINFVLNVSGASADLRNNISYNPKTYHIKLATYPGSWVEANNIYYPDSGTIFYNNYAKDYASYVSGHPAKTYFVNNLVSDPLFISTTSFAVASNSPAINKGDNNAWKGWKANVFDITNSVGITDSSAAIIAPGGIVDIGAYERNTTTQSTTTPQTTSTTSSTTSRKSKKTSFYQWSKY